MGFFDVHCFFLSVFLTRVNCHLRSEQVAIVSIVYDLQNFARTNTVSSTMSSPRSTPDSEPNRLDLAARTIDLISTVANASSKSNPILSGILKIGEWLGREKLSRFALQDCLEKAKGLAMPNSTGEAIFPAILKRGNELPVGHLFLRTSGSLGLLIARDPNLQWMVSTVACLFRFTNQENSVSEAVCDYILGLRTTNKDSYRPVLMLRQDPLRIQLKAVLDKIVSSIWLNIVNSGSFDVNLPDELKEFCPRGHNLDSHQFSDVAICLNCPHNRIVIRSQHLLQNLALWLHHHFHGRLQVTVGGQILYKKALGPEDREIDLRVGMRCSRTGNCKGTNPKIEVLVDISGRLQTVVTSQYPDREGQTWYNGSGVRQQFYIFASKQDREGVPGTDEFKLSTQDTAWSIVNWMLSRRVAGTDLVSRDLSLQVFLGSSEVKASEPREKPQLTVGGLLYRVPGIINCGWSPYDKGMRSGEGVHELHVWRASPGRQRASRACRGTHNNDTSRKNYDRRRETMLERIMPSFPILRDLVRKFKRLCFCSACSTPAKANDPVIEFKDGCLRTEALKVVFTLIAHSIADAMGCKDASGSRSSDEIFDGACCLIDEFACDRPRVTWKTWFHLAATVSLGCTFKRADMSKYDERSTTACIQYGSSALVASWLDISKDLKLDQCFAVAELRGGKIGVEAISADGSPQFVGIQEEFAIIQTEVTQDITTYEDAMIEKDPIPGDVSVTIPLDDSTAESSMFLLSITDVLYKVLLRVQTSRYSRFINPTDAAIGHGLLMKREDCEHRQDAGPSLLQNLPSGPPLYLYSFDELLGQWLGRARRGGGSPMQDDSDPSVAKSPELEEEFTGGKNPPCSPKALHVTQYLDTSLKVNAARALAVSSRPLICSFPFCRECYSAAGTSHIINEEQNEDILQRCQIAIRQ